MNPEQTLLQYGAIGAILCVLLLLFVWVFKVLFSRLIQHMDALQAFMTTQVQVMREISEGQRKAEDHQEIVRDKLSEMSSEFRRLREQQQRSGA
jgi:hypothetical protein